MSWVGKLYETYENCSGLIGVGAENPDVMPLLPVSHTTQNAHIEICIDEYGNFICGSSRVITEKRNQITIVPCTEKSANRTSAPEPHPLFDKLQYLAGDYVDYGGDEKKHCYESYIGNLSNWCGFADPSSPIKAIYFYLKKGRLIADLLSEGILVADKSGKVLQKWNGSKENMPAIYKVAGNPLDAFIRIRVQRPNVIEDRVWLDTSVWRSFVSYYNTMLREPDICYVQGNMLPTSEMSPAKIRNAADKAKLISSNDTLGFTFRGRFSIASQAASISYEATQKAHNALKWLISKQGAFNGDQVFVAWGTKNEETPDITKDLLELGLVFEDAAKTVSTREEYAARLRSAMAGYRKKLYDNSDIIIIGLDSATPGRLSIIYYREFTGTDFLDRLEYWHSTCFWRHTYKTDKSASKKNRTITFTGAPSPKDIVLAAYGTKAGEKLVASAVERLVPCILDRAPIPEDMVHSIVRRAGNPVAMDSWEYKKTLSIACAVVKKHYNDRFNRTKPNKESYEEVWKMALDKESNDRSYLFGRLLAYAQNVESYAMYISEGDSRQTNAERLIRQFTLKPATTWGIIGRQLTYYFKRLGENALSHRWKTEMYQIIDMIGPERFNDKRLDDIYIVGYASQMIEFENEKEIAKEKKGEQK